MEIRNRGLDVCGIKFFIEEKGEEVARAFVYFLRDDIEYETALIREFYILGQERDYGKILMDSIIKEANGRGCYKIICASRHGSRLQELLKREGFKGFGLEFRKELY